MQRLVSLPYLLLELLDLHVKVDHPSQLHVYLERSIKAGKEPVTSTGKSEP